MAGNQGLHSAENGRLGGRPRLEATKLREAVIRKAEEHADELADALIGKALGKDDFKSVDVSAHKEILDRGLGKSRQDVDITTLGQSIKNEVTELDDGQLDKLIASVEGTLRDAAPRKEGEAAGGPPQVRDGAPEAA